MSAQTLHSPARPLFPVVRRCLLLPLGLLGLLFNRGLRADLWPGTTRGLETPQDDQVQGPHKWVLQAPLPHSLPCTCKQRGGGHSQL